MSSISPNVIEITRSFVISGEGQVQEFFEKGWPYDERAGMYVKLDSSDAKMMRSNTKGHIIPYGFEGEHDMEHTFVHSLEELFGDFAISLGVKGSATALLVLYSLF